MKTAKEIADELWETYLDSRGDTHGSVTDAWNIYQEALNDADIVPTLGGYRFRPQVGE